MRNMLRAAALAALLALPASARWSFSPSVTVSVGTSATIMVAAGFSFARICNTDTAKTVFFSWNDTTLTTSTGDPLLPGQCIQFVGIASDQILRGITTSTTADVRVTKAVGG